MLHVLDLTTHEQTRLTCVLEALGDNYNPYKAVIGEVAAHALLYSGLDAEQQAIYDELVAAGVLIGA